MFKPQVVTVGALAASSDNCICLAQAAAGAQALTLNGANVSSGVATLDVARRVLVTSGGNDTGITFTITGTNHTGNPIQEVVHGVNAATISTTQDFKTVSSITTSGAVATTVKAGTSGKASSAWNFVNHLQEVVNFSIGVIVSGTVNYTIEYTYDNPNNNYNTIGSQGSPGNYPATPNVFSHATLAGLSANADGIIYGPLYAWRLTLNSQTNPGYATATAL